MFSNILTDKNKKPNNIKPVKVDPKILLHPNIPKPLHGVNPRTIMGEDEWKIVREKAYRSNNYCCYACAVHKSDAKYYQWLEAHEAYHIDYKRHRMEIEKIVPLCHACHNYIHSGRLYIMMRKGEIDEHKFWQILEHGNNVLTQAKLGINPFAFTIIQHAVEEGECEHDPSWARKMVYAKRFPLLGRIFGKYDIEDLPDDTNSREWGAWRMVYNGIEYPPVHANYDAWYAHYNNGQPPPMREDKIDPFRPSLSPFD